MRKQLDLDIKGCCNQDLATTLKALMENYNDLVTAYELLVTEVDALVDYIEANKAAMGSGDFTTVIPTASSDHSIDID